MQQQLPEDKDSAIQHIFLFQKPDIQPAIVDGKYATACLAFVSVTEMFWQSNNTGFSRCVASVSWLRVMSNLSRASHIITCVQIIARSHHVVLLGEFKAKHIAQMRVLTHL